MNIPPAKSGEQDSLSHQQDHELIFRLAGSDPSQPETIRILLETCLKLVLLYGKAMLELSGSDGASPELEARTLDAFSNALRRFNSLENQADLTTWIMGFARRSFHWTSWVGNLRGAVCTAHAESPDERSTIEFRAGSLSHADRELLLLRHLMGLDLHQLAGLYGQQEKTILRRLERIRKRLANLPDHDPDADHAIRHSAQLFQLKLEAELSSQTQIQTGSRHSCAACDQALSAWESACAALDEKLQATWTEPDVSQDDLDAYLVRLARPDRGAFRWQGFRVPWAEIIAIAGITLALTLALRETRRERAPAMPIFPPTPVHGPTPVPAVGGAVLDQSQSEDSEWWSIPAYHVAPRLSDDGRTLSFFYAGDLRQTGDRNGMPDFFRYDIDRGRLEWIQSPVRVGSYHMGWTSTADGRLTVFSANLSSIFGFADFGSCDGPCTALVLYDESTDSGEWLFASEGDRQPESRTAYPYLTGDGRYLSFFSTSQQLIDQAGAVCPSSDVIQESPAFLLDRVTDELIALPFCITQAPTAYLPLMEVSVDGRYVLIKKAVESAAGDSQTSRAEYVLYDRGTEQVIPFPPGDNQAAGDIRILEAHFARAVDQIVFSTPTPGLVSEDTNSYVDVYVWEIASGLLELVSTANGEATDGHSGSRFSAGLPSQSGEFAISSDGRYVVFVSLATNLVPGLAIDCGEFFRRSCGNIYLRDRILNTTRLLVQEPLQEAYFTDLSISGDGKRIAFLEQRFGCFPTNYCTNLWIHEVDRGYTFDPLWGNEFNRDTAAAGNFSAGQSGAVYPSKTYTLSDSTISAMELSPDGNVIATGLSSGHILLWNAASGTLERDLAYQDLPVFQIQFTPAGDRLFAAARDGSLALIDVGTGELLFRTFETPERFQAMALDPAGKWLALAGHNELWLRSVQGDQGRLEFLQRFEQGPIRTAAFSHDSGVLAVGVGDGTVWLLDMQSRQVFMRLGGHAGRVLRVLFSPRDMHLATAGEDRKLNLWKVSQPGDGQPTAELVLSVLHQEWAGDMSFTPDASAIACLTFDHKVRFYPFAGGLEGQPQAVIAGGVLLNVSFDRESEAMYLASDLSVMRIDGPMWREATNHAGEEP
jgi:WD40 repeat protein